MNKNQWELSLEVTFKKLFIVGNVEIYILFKLNPFFKYFLWHLMSVFNGFKILITERKNIPMFKYQENRNK